MEPQRSSETPLLQPCQWDLLKKKKSALLHVDPRRKMSEPFTCINSYKPKSSWQINSSDTAGPVVSLYPVSHLSFLSLPPSLQSISHLKCPGIFLQMSINRQIDFISSAALLQSWWMNLTFLSSYGDIVWYVFLFYFLGRLAGMFNSEVVLSEFYRTKTKMYFPGPMVQN